MTLCSDNSSLKRTQRESVALYLGKPALNERGYNCCGKPRGCTNMNAGCAYLQHPYKRWVRGEIALEEVPTS